VDKRRPRYGVANCFEIVMYEILGYFRRDDGATRRGQGLSQEAQHPRCGYQYQPIELVARARAIDSSGNLQGEQLHLVAFRAAFTVNCVPIVVVAAAEPPSRAIRLELAVRTRCIVVQRTARLRVRLRLRDIEEIRITLMATTTRTFMGCPPSFVATYKIKRRPFVPVPRARPVAGRAGVGALELPVR